MGASSNPFSLDELNKENDVPASQSSFSDFGIGNSYSQQSPISDDHEFASQTFFPDVGADHLYSQSSCANVGASELSTDPTFSDLAPSAPSSDGTSSSPTFFETSFNALHQELCTRLPPQQPFSPLEQMIADHCNTVMDREITLRQHPDGYEKALAETSKVREEAHQNYLHLLLMQGIALGAKSSPARMFGSSDSRVIDQGAYQIAKPTESDPRFVLAAGNPLARKAPSV